MFKRTKVNAQSAFFYVALLGLASVPIIFTKIIPVIDFYNHISRYYILARLDSVAYLQANYASNWSILPNMGMDMIGTVLLRICSPLISAKILLLFIFTVQYSGVLYFNRHITGQYSRLTAMLMVPLLYSFIFIWGFANFLLATGVVFWALGMWIREPQSALRRISVACFFAIVIFLCHGLAFALYGILIFCIEIGKFLEKQNFSARSAVKALILLLIPAIIPAILFMVSETATLRMRGGSEHVSIKELAHTGQLIRWVGKIILYRLQTIVRVSESPSIWFDIITFTLVVVLLGGLMLRRQLFIRKLMWPALVASMLLVVLTPLNLFGVGYVSDRMPLLFALILIGSLDFRPQNVAVRQWCMSLLGVSAGLRLIYLFVAWQPYSFYFEEFRRVAALIPPHSLVAGLNVRSAGHFTSSPRCDMYGPLLISLYGHAGPLFAFSSQQPLKLRGRLAYAVAHATPISALKNNEAPEAFSRYIDTANKQGLFDYLLICNAKLLPHPLPADATVLAETNQFTLLKLRVADFPPQSGQFFH